MKNYRVLADLVKALRSRGFDFLPKYIRKLTPALRKATAQRGLESHSETMGLGSDVQDTLSDSYTVVTPCLLEELLITHVELQVAGLTCLASDVVTLDARSVDGYSEFNLVIKNHDRCIPMLDDPEVFGNV